MNRVELRAHLEDIKDAGESARQTFYHAVEIGADPYQTIDQAEWLIESAFLKLLVLTEQLGLLRLREEIKAYVDAAKKGTGGLALSAMGVEESYSVHLARFTQYVVALEVLSPQKVVNTPDKLLAKVIRQSIYAITSSDVHKKPPSDETEVHWRIETILKCVFPDVKHKPSLSKPIKNFQPDTGIPSLRTLVEYKFIGRKDDVAPISDEILADTRGYHSNDWDHFVYVIYETRRFRSEKDWTNHLRACGTAQNSSVIVLSGEQGAKTRKKLAQSVAK